MLLGRGGSPDVELFDVSIEAPPAVPYRHGEEFTYSVPLLNAGSDEVEVLGFEPYYLDAQGLERLGIRIAPARSEDTEMRPFQPFTMQPGEIWVVEFRHRFAHCADFDRASRTWNGMLWLEVEAGGSKQTVSIPSGPVEVLLRDYDVLRHDVVLGPGC